MSNASPKNFSFIRVHPIKGWGRGDLSKSRKKWGLAGNLAHDLRFIDAPNADAKRIASNLILCAKTGWKPLSATKKNLKEIGIKDSGFLTEIALEMIADKGIIVQKNHVKAAMLMAAVSPEYLRDGDLNNEPNPEKARKLLEGTTAYLRKKYGERVLAVIYHEDEQNPHVSAYMLPLIEKTLKATGRTKKGMEGQERETRVEWRLSFADFFRRDKRILEPIPGSDKKKFIRYERGPCTILQDEYAEELQKYGLKVQRGIRKADEQRALQYEATKERYDRLRTPPTEIEGMDFDQLREWAAQVIPVLKEVKRAREERDNYQKSSGHHQQRADTLEKTLAETEKTLAEMQREIPVEEVIKKLTGLDPHVSDRDVDFGADGLTPPKKKRKDIESEFLLPNGQRIGITGDNGFLNLTPEIPFPGSNSKRSKGRGAISAVKYVTDWNHSEAEKWLVDVFGDQEAAREVARNFREQIPVDRDDPARIRRANRGAEMIFDLETPDASRWPEASHMLTETFRFRGDSVDLLRENQWIAANQHGHFVFQKVLASGTDFLSGGSLVVDPKHPTIILSDTGEGLHIHPGDDNLILCATPMDALAIKSSGKHHAATVVVIGKNPTETTLATLHHLMDISRGMKVLADNLTIVGQRLAIWITLHFPNLGNLSLPSGCLHWLDAHHPPTGPDTAQPDPAQPESERAIVEEKNQEPEENEM